MFFLSSPCLLVAVCCCKLEYTVASIPDNGNLPAVKEISNYRSTLAPANDCCFARGIAKRISSLL